MKLILMLLSVLVLTGCGALISQDDFELATKICKQNKGLDYVNTFGAIIGSRREIEVVCNNKVVISLATLSQTTSQLEEDI